jgi:hypothetical protein
VTFAKTGRGGAGRRWWEADDILFLPSSKNQKEERIEEWARPWGSFFVFFKLPDFFFFIFELHQRFKA